MRKIAANQQLAILWLTTSVIGAFFIYSATYKQNSSNNISPYATVLGQLFLIVIGIVMLICVYRFKRQLYLLLYNLVEVLFYFSLGSLALIILLKVFATYLGITSLTRGGAYQVIPLFVFDFQPLEMYKITVILFFAKQVGKPDRIRSFNEVFRPIILCALGAFLILLQPDTGGFLIVSTLLAALVFVNNEFVTKFFKYAFVILAVIGILFFVGKLISTTPEDTGVDYRSKRLQAYVDPFSDPQDAGSNIINSALAISSGVGGKGYLNSTQSTGYLFAAKSDFIFAIICEQFGIFGAALVMGLLILISYRSFQIARTAGTRFGELYCYGFGFLILIQSFVNIAGVIGLIPMTGVTLPFISTGLNSYLFLTIGLFCVILVDLETKRQARKVELKAKQLFKD